MLQTHDLQPGDHLILRDFGQTPMAYRKRLIALGLTYHKPVQLIRFAPLGCPMYLQIQGGATLAIRKTEAQFLSWEKLCSISS